MDYFEMIERKLDLPQYERCQVMRELRSHFEDIRDELISSGMMESHAALEAQRRLGRPSEIAAHLMQVHGRTKWSTTLFALVPFVILIPPLTLALHQKWLAAIFAVLMLGVSIRGIITERRPVWLATWLGAFIALLLSIINPNLHVALVLGTPLATVLIIIWDSPKAQQIKWIISGILGIVLLVCIFFPNKISLSVSPVFIGFILLITYILPGVLGYRLFIQSPNGSALNASLFVASVFLFTSQIYSFPGHHFNYFAPILLVLGVLTIAVYTRLTRQRDKLITLIVSAYLPILMLIYAVLNDTITRGDNVKNAVLVLPLACLLYGIFLFWPALIERKTWRLPKISIAVK